MYRPPVSKEKYYYHAAKRFMMDAQLLRCRAAIHVEDKDDIVFWSNIFKHFRPNDRFHFIAGSRNERGHETRGVTQCLKYVKYLNPKFFICIDSDYRYLLQEQGIDVKHYIFQTYTYSFENHHCYDKGLNELCYRITALPNNVFDFHQFLKEYSNIVYKLFLWHLYFLVADPKRFSIADFNELISFQWQRRPDIRQNGRHELNKLKGRIEQKLAQRRKNYPKANLSILEEKYQKMGLTPDTTYLFIRGHNIYDMVYMLNREVCKKVLRIAKDSYSGSQQPPHINLFGYRNSIDDQLKKNLHFGAYPAIRKIEEDIHLLF